MAKRNITFIQQEPSFIRQFKAKAGYKEGPTLESKRVMKPDDDDVDDDFIEPEDEMPQVVILQEGDLTEEEAKKKKLQQDVTPKSVDKVVESENSGGGIKFKKPSKRSSEDQSDLHISSKKKKDKDTKEKQSNKSDKCKKVKNKTLLSFDEEEDDD